MAKSALRASEEAQRGADQQSSDTLQQMVEQTDQMIWQTWAQDQTAKALQETAGASVKTLDNARQSITIAKEALEKSQYIDRQDRGAWVGVQRVGLAGDNILNSVATIAVVDVGKTPAREVRTSLWMTNENSGIVPTNLFQVLKPRDRTFVLTPSGTEFIKISISDFGIWDLRKMQRIQQSLFLLGVVDYKDVWDEKHQTKFCFETPIPIDLKLDLIGDPCLGDLNTAN